MISNTGIMDMLLTNGSPFETAMEQCEYSSSVAACMHAKCDNDLTARAGTKNKFAVSASIVIVSIAI
jgi:hypothetical protein